MLHTIRTSYKAARPAVTKVARQVLPATDSPVLGAGQEWLLLVVENTTGARALAALFDASGKFELKDGIQTQDGVTIRATNCDYGGFLNDLASTEQYAIDLTRVEITSGSNLQLDNPWLIKEDKRLTNSSNTVAEIYPSTFKGPYQQQANRVDVTDPYTITRQRIMEIQVEPNTVMVLRMAVSKSIQNG